MIVRLSVFRLLAVALTIAACNRGPNRKPGDDYLKAIKFEGNKELGRKTLVSGLALNRTQKRGRAPDPYMVQVDGDRIRGEYLRKGFLAVDVRSRVERAGDAATVIYTVDEGARATTRVVIKGLPDDPDLPAAKIREQLPLRDGQPFDYQVYEEAKPLLLGVAEDAGYAYAKLESLVYADRANHEAIGELTYDPGPKCVFGDVEISGVEGALADAVRERLQFQPGQRYSTQAIAATQRQLYALNRFSTVQVQTDETPNPSVRVKVAVSEAARHELRFGGGFGIDNTAYEVRGRAGYTVAGWPYAMDTFTVDLRPAYAYLRDGSGFQPRIRALTRLERQDIFWTYSTGMVEAGYNYLAVEAFTSYGPRVGLGFATPLKTDKLLLRLGWNLERLAFRAIAPEIDDELKRELNLDDVQRLGQYTQALTADFRDNPVQPRLGVYGELRVAEGTQFAGGAFEYVQLVPELRGYVPIGPVVMAARVRTGTFFGDVPATERFFSGGGSSHRGFGERQLSPYAGPIEMTEPMDPADMMKPASRRVPYGGRSLVETGIEARIPLATWKNIGIGAVTFLDGGDVTEELADVKPFQLHWAAGAGLRLNTIVGPVRLDFGYRLNRTGETDPAPGKRFAFHFSLGEAF